MSVLCQGRLVWTVVVDPRGNNPKKRPVLILTSSEEIKTETVLVGIVCSGSAAEKRPRPANYIPLPYQCNGLCTTKLKKPTVAIVGWYSEVPNKEFNREDVGGVVMPSLLANILKAVLGDKNCPQELKQASAEGDAPLS